MYTEQWIPPRVEIPQRARAARPRLENLERVLRAGHLASIDTAQVISVRIVVHRKSMRRSEPRMMI
jgi:hypothetical protein